MKRFVPCTVAALLLIWQETGAQTVLRVDLNVANCVAHTRSMRFLRDIGECTSKTIGLLRSDSSIAPRIIQRMGLTATEFDFVYSNPNEHIGNLFEGTFSRVRLYHTGELLLDIELDSLESYVSHIRMMCSSAVFYDSIPISAPIAFTSKSAFAANESHYWILDRLLGSLYCVTMDSVIGQNSITTLNLDSTIISAELSDLGLPPLRYSGDAVSVSESIEPYWVAPNGPVGDSATVFIRTFLQADHHKGRFPTPGGTVSMFLRIVGGDVLAATVLGPADTSGNAVRPFLGYSGVVERGDSLLGMVVRSGKADSYPLFAFLRPNGSDSAVRISSIPEFRYPPVLWDHGYQYQFTNGSFGNSIYAFSAFPLVVTTDDWQLHDVSSQLGVQMDSALARVRFHYHCKKVFDSGGIVTMLCYIKGETVVARFERSSLRLIATVKIDVSRVDPTTLVLVNHHLILALDRKRETLWRIRCG